jgi:hypothetical protein
MTASGPGVCALRLLAGCSIKYTPGKQAPCSHFISALTRRVGPIGRVIVLRPCIGPMGARQIFCYPRKSYFSRNWEQFLPYLVCYQREYTLLSTFLSSI